MKLLKNNVAKLGVMALAVSALGGSVFAANQMQGKAQNEGKVLQAVAVATSEASTEIKPGDFIGYAMGDGESSEPQAMIMGENGEIVYRALTEEEAKELENADMGLAVGSYELSEEELANSITYSFSMDPETGKVTEGMSKELVGNGVFGSTGINGEEMTAQHMEIKEDGTVITRALTQKEMKESGLK